MDNQPNLQNVFGDKINVRTGQEIPLTTCKIVSRYNNMLRLNISTVLQSQKAINDKAISDAFKGIINGNVKKPSILISKNKGGFGIYSAGSLGFLPKKQIRRPWAKMLAKKRKSVYRIITNGRYLPMKLPLRITAIKSYINERKKTFRHNKLTDYKNDLNIVYLSTEEKYERKRGKIQNSKFNNKRKPSTKKRFHNNALKRPNKR